MTNISIEDNNLYDNYQYLYKVFKYTLKKLKQKRCCFSIIFVNNKDIQKINKTYRKIDDITDVISFALEDNEDIINKKNIRLLGEIYICIPRMKEQAIKYGHSEKRELTFLCVHGLLHLLGYDHIDKKDEEEMFSLQELILNEQNIKR